jgi:hypothetical protein
MNRRHTAPTLVTALALGTVALLFTSCGGTSGPGVARLGSASTTTTFASASPAGRTGSNAEAQLLKYSQCMQRHGLRNFPDPTSQGDLSIKAGDIPGGPDSPQFKAAQKVCQSLMPGALTTSAEKAAANVKALAFAQCMRAHGVANFPDPNGQGVIEITPATNLDMNSRQYNKAQSACQNLNNGFETLMRGGPGPGAGGPKGNSGS